MRQSKLNDDWFNLWTRRILGDSAFHFAGLIRGTFLPFLAFKGVVVEEWLMVKFREPRQTV
jgi:hypothetical protein